MCVESFDNHVPPTRNFTLPHQVQLYLLFLYISAFCCQVEWGPWIQSLLPPPSFPLGLFNLSLSFWLKNDRITVRRLMDITMTLALFLLLWLLPATGARYLSGGATETPPGFTATDGISPVPTEAPGLNGIPMELRKRAIQTFLTSPPSNWCGFFDGDYREFWAPITSFTGKLII